MGLTIGECFWSRADDDTDMWETSCGHAWLFTVGGPRENGQKFCGYCGRALKVESVKEFQRKQRKARQG